MLKTKGSGYPRMDNFNSYRQQQRELRLNPQPRHLAGTYIITNVEIAGFFSDFIAFFVWLVGWF